MSIINQIPKGSPFIQTVNRFTATFNNPTPGMYDFGVAANVNQIVFPLTPRHVYFVDRINFSCTVPEGEFLLGTSTPCQIVCNLSTDGRRVFRQGSVPVVNYIDSQEVNTYIFDLKAGRAGAAAAQCDLTMSFTGILDQIAAWVGIPTIVAQVSLNIYEVRDGHWIESFRSASARGIGSHLVTG